MVGCFDKALDKTEIVTLVVQRHVRQTQRNQIMQRHDIRTSRHADRQGMGRVEQGVITAGQTLTVFPTSRSVKVLQVLKYKETSTMAAEYE